MFIIHYVQPLILDQLSLVKMLVFISFLWSYVGKLITLEAMSGLSKVLLYLDKKNVHLLVVYIFMKIKPFLESVSFLYIFEDDIYRMITLRIILSIQMYIFYLAIISVLTLDAYSI